MNFADNSKGCWQILMKFFEGLDVSLATNHLILMLIRIQDFLTEFLPQWNGGSCKKFGDLLPWRRFVVSKCF